METNKKQDKHKSCSNCKYHYQNGKRCDAKPCYQGSNWSTLETEVKTYRAGNWLRGFFQGEFSSLEEAWAFLSRRFLISYPTDDSNGQRSIIMEVKEKNSYGFESFTCCKDDLTERNELDKEDVLKQCTHSHHIGI